MQRECGGKSISFPPASKVDLQQPVREGKDPGWLAFSSGGLGSEAVSASVNGDESIHTAGVLRELVKTVHPGIHQ